MCPAMTAEPIWPGGGLPVYQPATDVLAGTCMVPRAVRPSLIRRVWTPMTGMDRYTGRLTLVTVAGRGGAATTPAGGRSGRAAGRALITWWPPASSRPPTPPPAASRPPQSSAAATGRRVTALKGQPGLAWRALQPCRRFAWNRSFSGEAVAAAKVRGLPAGRLSSVNRGMGRAAASSPQPDHAHCCEESAASYDRQPRHRRGTPGGCAAQPGVYTAHRHLHGACGVEQVIDLQIARAVQDDDRVNAVGDQLDHPRGVLAATGGAEGPRAGVRDPVAAQLPKGQIARQYFFAGGDRHQVLVQRCLDHPDEYLALGCLDLVPQDLHPDAVRRPHAGHRVGVVGHHLDRGGQHRRRPW